jgi:hypothetical protein
MSHEDYSDATVAWANLFNRCWRCQNFGDWGYGLVIHHFVRGTSRVKNNLATTSILCQCCHHEEHNGDDLGVVGMLALKKQYDPNYYDLAEVLRLRGRAPGSITEDDVDSTGQRNEGNRTTPPYGIQRRSDREGDSKR